MNKRLGKVYGPTGLVVMTSALIVLILVAGLSVGWMRSRCSTVGREIKRLEEERISLDRDNRHYEQLKSRATDVLSLQAAVKDRLQKPTEAQIVNVRRLSKPPAVRTSESYPTDPRFTALDIAFINSAPARGNARR